MLRLVRRVLVALVALLVLAVVLAGAITWVFSGRIRSAALEVKPARPSYDVEVVSVDSDRIVLDDADDHHDGLHRGWTYGIRWPGGSGVVEGPPERARGHEVALGFRLLSGAAVQQGTEVDVFRDLYDDPGEVPDLGLRRVRYDDGEHAFPAYVAEPTRDDPVDPVDRPAAEDRWAVLVHGKGGSPFEMVRMARDLLAAGRTVMLIGYRNDADQWEDPSHEYGYGTTEWRDLHAALTWAHERGARDVVLGGVSMGGAIVASYLQHVPDHQGISGVVLDSPMLDLDTVVSWGAREEHLPGGLPLPEPITWAAKRVAGLRFDLDWRALDYVDGAHGTDWADVPVLVLHGDEDRTVPVSLSRELAKADDDVRLEEFPGADHVESWNSDPQRYDRLVTDFAEGLQPQ